MAVKNLFLLAFLTAQVSCGKNSLSFVIDDTMSMYYEIKQVKNAAKEIVDIVLNEQSSQIEDIVLVTFNDPDIEFRKRTHDGEELKQALDSIEVDGGGDCPEMALTGIKLALEESRPGSYLFVFTDAPAKDYEHFDEIKTLSQDKQCQIFIVVTNRGVCRSKWYRHTPSSPWKILPSEAIHVYHRIAAASNGQVFWVDKDDVDQVLGFVKETIKGDRTVIASTIVPAKEWRNIEFKIDDHTEYAIVSASGDNVILQIIDQNEVLKTKIAHITWTDNVKVVKLQNLTPGTYLVKVYGETEVNIMVFGRTDFTFQHGFSTQVETSLRTTETQPTTDIKTHLMVSVKDPEHSANVQSIELLDMNDRKIRTLRLTHVQGDVYATEKFLSPSQTFKIAVIATSRRTGKTVRRVAKTPVTPIRPVYVAPELSKTEIYIKLKEGASVTVHCRVRKGKPNPEIKWFLKREHEKDFKVISGKMDKELQVTNAQTNDYYKCVATNTQGHDEHTVQLDVQARPAFENTPHVITKNEGELVTIDCKLRKGNPRPNVIEWHFKRENLNYEINLKNTGDKLSYPMAQLEHSGMFRCIANNTEGTAEKITKLVVQVAPELSKTEKYIKVKEGASLTVHCRVRKGKPNPEIKWFLKREHDNDFKEITGKIDKELQVTNAQTNDYYKCVATNTQGHDEHTVQLDVQARPAFENTPHVITKNEGELVTIECKLRKGNPRPNVIEWHFKRENLNYEINLKNTGDKLSYPMAQLEHSGMFRCIANNTEGTAEKITKLVVQVAPELSKTEKYIKVKEGASLTVHCRVRKGKPNPEIKWFLKREHDNDFKEITGKIDKELQVTNAQTNDYYKCVATNTQGHDEHTVQLDVQARPAFENTPHVITKNEGELVTIECKLRKGNPRPNVIDWHFKRENLNYEINLKNTGDKLSYPMAQLEHSGMFRCIANNTEGTAEKITKLVVQVAPELSKTEKYIKVKEGASLTVHCRVRKGKPNPEIKWFLKREHDNDFKEITGKIDKELQVTNAQTNDYYKCVATNTQGHDEHTVQLDVQARPAFENTPHVITKNEGELVTIECKLRKGNPRPNVIEWHFKRENLNYEINLKNTGDKLSYPMAQLEHSGMFRCIAKNTEGTAEKITKLVVQVKPVLANPEPYKSAMENTTVIIRCPVTRGFPQPTINWFYKNPSSSEYISISKNEENLKLENIQLSTAGMYKCVAKNIVGDANIVVQLTVNAPPRIVFIPPNTPDYFGVEGDVVMRLPCTAVGHPTPKITWKVDEKIVGSDKSKEMYVDDNTLVLKNPKETNSTNNTRSYDCRASNEFGEVNQTYNVAISEYSDFNEPDETTCNIHKQPFVLNCPLPYSDPNSVRWYKNAIYHNVTGPTLRFDDPTQSDSNNYTCRVSDINHAASYTFEAIFGFPPTRDVTSLDIEWEGEEAKTIDCRCTQYPEGTYIWFYNGEKIKNINSPSLTLNGWGQYSCQVTNPLGSLIVNFKITTVDQNCVIPKSVFETKHMPLVLDSSSSWPAIKTVGEYFVVPHSEKLNLICQDDTPVTETIRNKFKNFLNSGSVYATCDNEESFLVDGVTKKFSELDCKENVTPRVKPTGQRCLGENTQLMEIGFYVNGFTEVYQSCVDMVKNVPLYTKMNTIPLEWEAYAREVQIAKEFCMDECCYETIQLVNAVDVGLGPAKNATYRDNLNYVNYCKPSMSNHTNWHVIEQTLTRKKIQYTVWSGAVNYSKVGTIWTPKYLWKVLKEVETSEMIAVVHENVQKPGPKLCEGECGETTIWLEPEGDRTYCCSLDNFKKALGITIDFEES